MQEARDQFDRMQQLILPRPGLGLLVVDGFPDHTGYDIDAPRLPRPAAAAAAGLSRRDVCAYE